MSWIESHEEIGDHHKTHSLAQKLNCTVPTAVGYMHLLWHYTLKVSWQFGDLSKQTNFSIARACWFDGKPEELIKSFQKSGILDGMLVHDWEKYAKQLIYQRLYNTSRKDKKNNTSVVTAVSTAMVKASTIPNHTIPNQKINTYAEPVRLVFDYFCTTMNKKIKLSTERGKIIEQRLKEGRTVEEMKTAINNFSKDTWEGRHKYWDLVYVIGTRKEINNLDKWLNFEGQNGNSQSGKRLL